MRARKHFPTGVAALKCVYFALMSLDPTGKGRRRRTMRWKMPPNAFQLPSVAAWTRATADHLNNQAQPLVTLPFD